MSVDAKITKTVVIGGKTLKESTTIEGEASIFQEETVPAAEAGSLTTKTDADTGVVTVDASGHSITDTDYVDIYWADGCRRNMQVTSVTVNAISVDGGLGDDLPVQDTEVTITIPVEMDVVFSGTKAKSISCYTAKRGQFVFEDAGGEELAWELGDGIVKEWHDESKEDNPVTGDSIIKAVVSHESTAAQIMQVGIIYNNA